MPPPSFLQKQANKASNKRQQQVQAVQQALEPEVREIAIQKQQASAVVPAVGRNTVSVANNLTAAAISSNMTIDVDLKTDLIGQLLGNVVKITVNNTTLADLTPPKNAQEMINMRLKSNDGNHQLCEMTKDTLIYPLRFLDPSTLTRYKSGYESNKTTVVETETVSIVETTVDEVVVNEVIRNVVSEEHAEVIVPGASRTWYIPLLSDPFAINEVFMQAVKGRLVYSFEFNKDVWVDGSPSLTECSIVSRHLYYSPEWMANMKKKDLGSIRDYNFRSYVVKNSDKIITAGANVEVILDGFTKKASEVFLQLWKNGEQLTDLGNYIDSYNITNAGNESLIGSGPIDSTYDDIILSAVHEYEPVIGATRDPWTVISFSPDMANDFQSGEVHGHRHFTGGEILKLKISADLPGAGYSLRIYYGELNKMRSVGGMFNLTE